MAVLTILNHTRNHVIQGFGLGHYRLVFRLREACDTKRNVLSVMIARHMCITLQILL